MKIKVGAVWLEEGDLVYVIEQIEPEERYTTIIIRVSGDGEDFGKIILKLFAEDYHTIYYGTLKSFEIGEVFISQFDSKAPKAILSASSLRSDSSEKSLKFRKELSELMLIQRSLESFLDFTLQNIKKEFYKK